MNIHREVYVTIRNAISFLLVVWLTQSSIVSWQSSRGQELPTQETPSPSVSQSEDIPARRHWLRSPRLVVPETKIQAARFPVVDVHTHFYVKGKHNSELLDGYVHCMDRNNIAISVSLDATLGTRDLEHIRFLKTRYPNRFLVFANIDFRGTGRDGEPSTWACNQSHFVRNAVEQLRSGVKEDRIVGLKFFKDFGLSYKDESGKLLAIDDERWDPLWKACGDLGIPVLMHTADPSAFFLPADPSNERQRELESHPDWSFASPSFPSRDSLHEARNRVIQRHPNTIFIGAHFANDAEDLRQLSEWLDEMPNLMIEFASRINELGRQPYTARRFFVRYQDRILFGTDGPWPEERLKLYWRFLETQDEYFPYSEKSPPPQGDWNIYGIFLEDHVLRKIYHENAERIIPGVSDLLRSNQ